MLALDCVGCLECFLCVLLDVDNREDQLLEFTIDLLLLIFVRLADVHEHLDFLSWAQISGILVLLLLIVVLLADLNCAEVNGRRAIQADLTELFVVLND